MTLRNFIQNYFLGILITGLVYGTGYCFYEIVENGFDFKDLAMIPAAPFYLGMFALIFSLPYFIIMVVSLLVLKPNSNKDDQYIRGIHVLLCVITIVVGILVTDTSSDRWIVTCIILGYAITGTVLLFRPTKTLRLEQFKNYLP